LDSGPRLGGPSTETLLMERPCANDSSGPLLIDGRSQTAKSGFVDDAEPAISGCISIIGRRAALSRVSRSQATSQDHSNTSTMPNFGGCSRPSPSRSIVAIKAMRRRKALPLRWLGLQRKTNLYRFPIKPPERSTRYRKEKQISSEHHFGRGLSLWP
jgi:hypothetical protein